MYCEHFDVFNMERESDDGRMIDCGHAATTVRQDDQKEGLLGYDDTAFYYFFSSVLAACVTPLLQAGALQTVDGRCW